MSVQAVSSRASATTATTAPSTTKPSGLTLDADTFMKMFTTQIANQDPMSPMDSADFLNQFAQITSVQTMSELQKTLTTVSDSIAALTRNGNISEATSLLGQNVTFTGTDGSQHSGAVDSIRIGSDGTPLLNIGGTEVDLSAVTHVRTPAA